MANNNITFKNNSLTVSFNEKKGKALDNYEMYTEGIKALSEVGRVATLKIVEAVARVNTAQLWKLGNSEKTCQPYTSINEWAITEFGYSKSHVSEMLSVAKQCCDIETGAPLECLAGYSYTQLLAFTKNPKLLLKVKAGECPDDITLATTAKDIKNYGIKAIPDKKEGAENGESANTKDNEQKSKAQSANETPTDDGASENGETNAPHEARTITVKMGDFERWYNLLSNADGQAELENATKMVLDEWNTVLGNPFA